MLRLATASILVLAACVGSPVPEPPNLDITRVIAMGSSGSGGSMVGGSAGAAVPGTIAWGVNLATTDPPSTAAVAEDGSFVLLLSWMPGDELRLQTRNSAGARSPAIDAVAPELAPPVRPLAACLALDPAVDLDFIDTPTGETVARRITIDNTCGSTVTIAATPTRASSTAFAALTPTPFDVADGTTSAIDVQFRPGSPGLHEEILFIEVGAPSMERRPITLIGTAR